MTVKVFLDISVIKGPESSGNNIGKIVLNTTLVGILNTIFNILKKKKTLSSRQKPTQFCKAIILQLKNK